VVSFRRNLPTDEEHRTKSRYSQPFPTNWEDSFRMTPQAHLQCVVMSMLQSGLHYFRHLSGVESDMVIPAELHKEGE
jgi:hypothetical protein